MFEFTSRPTALVIDTFRSEVDHYKSQIANRMNPAAASPSRTKKTAPHQAASSPGSDSPEARKRARPTVEEEQRSGSTSHTSEVLKKVKELVLPTLPVQFHHTYMSGVRARARDLRAPLHSDLSSKIGELSAGYTGIPLYRLFPQSRNNKLYCCVCGAASDTHTATSCTMLRGGPVADVPSIGQSLLGSSHKA